MVHGWAGHSNSPAHTARLSGAARKFQLDTHSVKWPYHVVSRVETEWPRCMRKRCQAADIPREPRPTLDEHNTQ
jgi:hypothetical protein